LKIRFKQPEADKSELLTFPVNKDIIEKDITQDNKFAISVAGFAQLYKDNKFLSTDYDYDNLASDIDFLKKGVDNLLNGGLGGARIYL